MRRKGTMSNTGTRKPYAFHVVAKGDYTFDEVFFDLASTQRKVRWLEEACGGNTEITITYLYTEEPAANATGQTYGQYVGPPAYDKLDIACIPINKAFDEVCYLVGSSLRKRDWRDVDVRLMMADSKADLLFGPMENLANYPLFNLLNLSITTYLRDMTGLPIDFQIQRQSWANTRFKQDNGHGRNPLGLVSVLSREQLPAWRTVDMPPEDDEDA